MLAVPRPGEELRRALDDVQEQRRKSLVAPPPEPGNKLAATTLREFPQRPDQPASSDMTSAKSPRRDSAAPAAAPGVLASGARQVSEIADTSGWLDRMMGVGLPQLLLGGFMALVVVGAVLRIASSIVTAAFRAAGMIISSTAWWRGSRWLWQHALALLRREQPEPVNAHGAVHLPPFIRTRLLRKPVLEERHDASGEHVGVFGPPGSGKSWCIFVPTLLDGWRGTVFKLTIVNLLTWARVRRSLPAGNLRE